MVKEHEVKERWGEEFIMTLEKANAPLRESDKRKSIIIFYSYLYHICLHELDAARDCGRAISHLLL